MPGPQPHVGVIGSAVSLSYLQHVGRASGQLAQAGQSALRLQPTTTDDPSHGMQHHMPDVDPAHVLQR